MSVNDDAVGYKIWGADDVVYGPVELPTMADWIQEERVTADTWVHTAAGPQQVCNLIGRPFLARVDGSDHPTSAEGFFLTTTKPGVSR